MPGTSIGRAVLDVDGRFDAIVKQGEQAAAGLGGVFSKHIGGALQVVAGGFAGYQIKGFVDDSVAQAESLAKGIDRTQQVFGKFNDQIVNWSKTSADTLNMSQADALKYADSIGLRLTSAMGYTGAQAAQTAPQLVQLAEDMSKFNRIPFDQAFDALQRGMMGQTKGLKSVGVNIDAAAVKHQALVMGLLKGTADSSRALAAEAAAHDGVLKATNALAAQQDKQAAALKAHGSASIQYRDATRNVENAQLTVAAATRKYTDAQDKANAAADGVGGTLTPAAKAQATYALILEQTKVQQGQTARSADELGSAHDRATARVENLKAKIGKEMVPSLAGQQVYIADHLIPTIDGLTTSLFKVPLAGAAVTDGLTGVAMVSEHATTIASLMSIGTVGWTGAAKLGGAAASVFKGHAKDMGKAVAESSGVLKDGAKGAVQLELALGEEKGVAKTAGKFGGIMGKFGGAFGVIKAPFAAAIGQSWAFTLSLLANPIALIIIALIAIGVLFVVLYLKCKPFHDFIDNLWASIKVLGSVIWGFLQAVPGMFMSVVNSVIRWVTDHWQLIVAILLGPIGIILLVLKDFGPQILRFFVDGLGKVVAFVKDVGGKIVTGLRDGIGTAWSAFVRFFEDKIKLLPGGVAKLLGLSSPSRVFAGIGRGIVDGISAGVDQQRAALLANVTRLGDNMQTAFQPTLAVAAVGVSASAALAPTSSQVAPLGVTVNQYINQPGADADAIAKAAGWELSRRGLTAR